MILPLKILRCSGDSAALYFSLLMNYYLKIETHQHILLSSIYEIILSIWLTIIPRGEEFFLFVGWHRWLSLPWNDSIVGWMSDNLSPVDPLSSCSSSKLLRVESIHSVPFFSVFFKKILFIWRIICKFRRSNRKFLIILCDYLLYVMVEIFLL